MASLTASQKTTLKNFILADPVLSLLPLNTDSYFTMALALNATASPDYWVWKSSLRKHDLTDQASDVGTVFDWGTAAGNFISRSQGERDCWAQVWNSSLTVNPSAQNVRDAFANIFSGSGAGAVNNRNHFTALARRKATIAEKLLASGTGSTASPATSGFEGTLSYTDIQGVMES